jgi:anti-sigma factor ChrR (cupin superfamily)
MEELAVNTALIYWEPAPGYHPGTLRKVLRRGDGGEPMAVLLKLGPGFEMGSHSHLSVEHHYVLEGEYESEGSRFPAGTYRVIPKGKEHGPFHSANGATVLVLWTD